MSSGCLRRLAPLGEPSSGEAPSGGSSDDGGSPEATAVRTATRTSTPTATRTATPTATPVSTATATATAVPPTAVPPTATLPPVTPIPTPIPAMAVAPVVEEDMPLPLETPTDVVALPDALPQGDLTSFGSGTLATGGPVEQFTVPFGQVPPSEITTTTLARPERPAVVFPRTGTGAAPTALPTAGAPRAAIAAGIGGLLTAAGALVLGGVARVRRYRSRSPGSMLDE